MPRFTMTDTCMGRRGNYGPGFCGHRRLDCDGSKQGSISQAGCLLLSGTLLENKVPLLTSNYVLTETYTRIRYDDGHGKATRFHSLIQQAIGAGRLRLEWVTPAIHQEAWNIFQDYADQAFSLVDCASFVIARKAGVTECFSFDEHFNTMGFILRPNQRQ